MVALPKLTGNLKIDLDNFESIENQNLFFSSTEHSSINSKSSSNHPNKHPDTFNKQISLKIQNNSDKDDNQINNQLNQLTNLNNQTSNKVQNKLETEKTEIQNNSNNQNETITTNLEAPYVKIFPLTPVVKNTETMTPNRAAFNNYAILTNKVVNSTNSDKNNKNLIESLGFGILNNKSIETPKQEVTSSASKVVKIDQNKDTNAKNETNLSGDHLHNIVKSNAQALNGQELENEKKNLLANKKTGNDKNQSKMNKTSIDVSKSNLNNNQRLAFSISLPKSSEPKTTKQENKKTKTKDNENFKKTNCRRAEKRNTPECTHCSYGLFRCTMGKCVITSFECGSNMTNTTRGRRVSGKR